MVRAVKLEEGFSGSYNNASQGAFAYSSSIAGRHIFYNDSAFDGDDPAQNTDDDNAIATDKVAYLPGDGLAVYGNITNFTKGITGIMIDLDGGGDHASIDENDFIFKVGNNNSPGDWATAPAPSDIQIRIGAGDLGSDRVVITWDTGDIRSEWLEVEVLSTVNTGLPASDVHYWGNRAADSGISTPTTVFQTTSSDSLQVYANLTGSAAIDNLFDYNRSGSVTSTDAIVVFANLGVITRIDISIEGPFERAAPPSETGDGRTSAVASALAVESDDPGPRSPRRGWLGGRGNHFETGHRALVRRMELMAERNTTRWQRPVDDSDWLAADGTLDDELLEALSVDRLTS